MIHKLFGVALVVIAVILLLNPVAMGFSVSTCGSIIIFGCIIGGAGLILA